MTEADKLNEVVQYWVDKSLECLEAAEDEIKAGRLSFSVNRIYYACFYLASAVLLGKGLRFKKHSGVRASFHQEMIKPGLVKMEYGLLYDELFEARQRGDYLELVSFESKQVEDWFNSAKKFTEDVKHQINI